MGLLFKRFEITPTQMGVMYRNNQRVRDLEPGIYRVFDPGRRTRVYALPTAPLAFPVYSQEALTQDGIAFRFSYTVRYEVADAERAFGQVALSQSPAEAYGGGSYPGYGAGAQTPIQQLHELLHAYVQASVKDRVATLTSEQITEHRAVVNELRTPELDEQAASLGLRILGLLLRDVTFPKAIQSLFARRLEAKIRAQSDLENARTTVAAARALKNASSMLAGDQTVLFLQYLETLTKISEKGNHTFHVEGVPQLASPATPAS
ncbi:MAG: SPFH domain-containing protein [Bacteroidota bacterium]